MCWMPWSSCPGSNLRILFTVGIWYWFILSRTICDISVKWKTWLNFCSLSEQLFLESDGKWYCWCAGICRTVATKTSDLTNVTIIWNKTSTVKTTQTETYNPQTVMNGTIKWLHWKLSYSDNFLIVLSNRRINWRKATQESHNCTSWQHIIKIALLVMNLWFKKYLCYIFYFQH